MSAVAQGSTANNIPMRFLPWIVWLLGCVFYFYEFLLQVSPSVMGTELMRDFSITGQTLGVLSGFYYYSYTPMQLPCGILMDRFGPHRMLTLATVICALSTLAFSMTDNLFTAFMARLMIGFGSAFAAVGTMKLASNWFSTKRFALLTGLMVTIGMLGAIGGEAPLALLVDHYGWRQSMFVIGIVGLFLAFFIFVIVRDQPVQSSASSGDSDVSEQVSMLRSLLVLVRNKQLWLVAVYGSLMFMATPVFCGLWGVPFLMLKMNILKATAAQYVSLVFIGWAIASPLWGICSNRIGLRKPPLYIGAVGAIVCSMLFIYAPIHTSWIMQILLFAFGVFSAGFLPSFSVAKELCSKHYVATGLGFMNMFNMIGIAFSQPFIGYVLDKMWAGELVHHVRIYPLNAYYIGLSILPIGMFLALLILPFLRETYCRSVEESA
jgi:MFS family permease